MAAIKTGGLLYVWGYNGSGQIGNNVDPATVSAYSSPVVIGASSWTSISAGSYFIAGIKSGGLLLTWGSNDSGQLGTNENPDC